MSEITKSECALKKRPEQRIHVLGLGIAEKVNFSYKAQTAIAHSQVIIGSERQLKTVSHLINETQQLLILPKLSGLKQYLLEHQDKTISLLASGDPLFFGIGKWLTQQCEQAMITFHPAISSIQFACHELGLSLQDVQVLSLHGRPLAGIRSYLKRAQYFAVLTDKNSHPCALAKECIAAGFSLSKIWVCEDLGYAQQRVREFSVRSLVEDESYCFSSLQVSIIFTQGDGGIFPEFPGIPDRHFITNSENGLGKGMITKREVRLSLLSLLQPANNDNLWDVGAGCGSISIELAYWNRKANVYAIEQHEERLSCLNQNRAKFGVLSNLTIVPGRAPSVLSSLVKPNKIFIGGSDGELPSLLAYCWQQLPLGGILVASSVTERTKFQLLSFAEKKGLEQWHDLQLSPSSDEKMQAGQPMECLQIAVSKSIQLAGQWAFKPSYPVTLFKFIKQSI